MERHRAIRNRFPRAWRAARVMLLLSFLAAGVAKGSPGPEEAPGANPFELAKSHWAFQTLKRPPIPSAVQKTRSQPHPIDAFITAKHREIGLIPAPRADRRTWLRRVTLDLTGLPPSIEEIEAFVGDSDPGARERCVERLLASPRYGERWGRFWLDLARWAESDGFEANELRSSAWRYRDYVVRSFNADKPYDRFLREQIAGDELQPYSDEHLIATGFLAAARNNNNEEDKVVQLNESLVDIANNTASVTLGLTLSCAQCHDHKFEPVTLRDYYSWHGFFLRGQVNTLLLQDARLVGDWVKSRPPELDSSKTLFGQLLARARTKLPSGAGEQFSDAELASLIIPAELRTPDDAGVAGKLLKASKLSADLFAKLMTSDDQKLVSALKRKIDSLERRLTETRPQTWGYYSPANSPHSISNLPPRGQYPFPYKPETLKAAQPAVLKRGNAAARGEVVASAIPAVLGGTRFNSRSDLVDWLASPANPLTARVWANFIWQQHFGRGLVETSGDFGVKGARPSNPALLDWLACELRESGWSAKRLHRLIVTSETYGRAAQHREAAARLDPDNRHLWRWQIRRLESEAIRDSWLAVAGVLDGAIGGPSDPPGKTSTRRAIYQLQQRHRLPEGQALFDAPVGNDACPRRHVSTVPLQPLRLLNSEEHTQLAERFAARIRAVAGDDRQRQIETAFRLALGRAPDGEERSAATLFLNRPADGAQDGADRALPQFAQAMLNLNEFLFIP